MGVLVRGMEMPKSCHTCELSAKVDLNYGHGYCCQILAEMISNTHERKLNCPLIPVPPHGRLIDADALKNTVYEALKYAIHDDNATSYGAALCAFIAKHIVDEIESAPTIIPAEKGEQDA